MDKLIESIIISKLKQDPIMTYNMSFDVWWTIRYNVEVSVLATLEPLDTPKRGTTLIALY